VFEWAIVHNHVQDIIGMSGHGMADVHFSAIEDVRRPHLFDEL
jgi:hypothetical protein